MLRASSLGLSHPLPNISALHTCRRLYGARRSTWIRVQCLPSRPRHASSDSNSHVYERSNNTDVDAETAPRPSFSPNKDHRQPAQVRKPASSSAPAHPPVTDQLQLEGKPEENLHVAYAQRHQRLLVLERLESEQEREILRVASLLEKAEAEGDGEKCVPLRENMQSDSSDIGDQEANLQTSEEDSSSQKREKRHRAEPMRTQRQVIEDAPPYAAGRPWSPTPILHAAIPGITIHLLGNIGNGLKKAHEKQKKQKEMEKIAQTKKKEMEKNAQRKKKKGSGGPPRRGGKSTAKATAVENSSSSLEGDKHRIEGENDTENMEELPPVEITDRIREQLEILGTTDSVDTAWQSYTYLIDTISCSPIIYNRIQHIPFTHLHRLTRLLSHNRPRTHVQYLRLLSVLTYIVHVGGTPKQFEWNALLDHVGAGRRRTTDADVEKALSAFESMRAGQLPGAGEFGLEDLPLQSSFAADVYTMTTLLSLAARARNPSLLKQISNIMAQSGILPNRITHLSLLRYFTEKKDLPGIRRTLRKMRDHGMELGLDGVNSCIWAFGCVQKLEIVLMIYRVLRHHKFPEKIDQSDPSNVVETISKLQEEAIYVDDNLIPNEISYTALIQTMAYNGQFHPAIRIFFDMLSTENVEQGAPLQPSESGDLVPEPYSPSVAVYRAIFLGFSRHGKVPTLVNDPDELDWTMKNLQELFDRFLSMPQGTVLTHPMLSIIISAFVQTSGGDLDVVRRAWVALDKRFGIVFHKEHSKSRLVRMQKTLFPDG